MKKGSKEPKTGDRATTIKRSLLLQSKDTPRQTGDTRQLKQTNSKVRVTTVLLTFAQEALPAVLLAELG